MNDLAADLAADLSAELAPPPTAARAGAPAASARRPVPEVSVVLTPLHWSRPSVSAVADGTGLVVRGGPWQVAVLVAREVTGR